MTIALALLSRVRYRGQEIPGSRLRGLLALLAGDPRIGCSTAMLVEGLWTDERPEHPTKALQLLVTRARARLGADLIVSTSTGYRLGLGEDEIDASAVLLRASASAQHSRADDHAAALEQAEAGLALCEGADNWDISAGADPLSALRAARTSTYRSLVRARALALSRVGRRAEAVEPLVALVLQRPRDEEVLVELLRCESASQGPATALARYDAYRQALRDELGSDPGPALQSVHRELLHGDTPVVRRGVRHEPNPLLGRDDDIAAVTSLLRTSRVTSIVGAGGLGKTRLAHVVSRQAEQRAVHFVGLAGVTADGDVAGEVAAALGVGESGHNPVSRLVSPTTIQAGILNALGPGLLVLDNCEHVVHGVAELVQVLVSMSADLRVLTTSRAPLGLSSESVYLLPELDLPTTVDLFGQRARAARPAVDLPADVVRALCSHLDGLPLAVELAAARVRIMSVTEVAQRLDDRFVLLRGGSRDTPQRHRTLHAVIDWSWNLLEPDGQAAMRALSVFPGGFATDAAQHLLGDEDVLHVLEQLVDQSLLKVVDTASGTRLQMLETVREFSIAHRDEAGETDAVVGRFLAWARDFGVTQHESISTTDLVSFAELARAEQDNLMQALRYGLDKVDGATVAATTAVLGGLWIIGSNFTRMAAMASDTAWTLSHFRPEPELVETTRTALVLCTVSNFLMQETVLRSLVALRRLPVAPPDTLPRAMQIVFGALTDPDRSALHALCDREEPLLAGMANNVVSYLWEINNDLDSALKAARRMLTAFEHQDVPWIRAIAHSRVGELCLQVDPGHEALRHLTIAVSAVEQLGEWSTATRGRWAMVLANLQCGALDEAERCLAQASQGGIDDSAGLSMFDVAVRAEIALGRGDVDNGLSLWRQAAGRLRDNDDLSALSSWALEVQAVAVVAHAWHGRLDLVEEITAELPRALSIMVADQKSAANTPVCGALLLALAMVDIDTGEPGAMRSGARMIALAERFRFGRGFQPTMSVARVRQVAEDADRPAYLDTMSSYAGLDPDALRAAALAHLGSRRYSARAQR